MGGKLQGKKENETNKTIVQKNKIKSHSSFTFHHLVLHGTPNGTVQLLTKNE